MLVLIVSFPLGCTTQVSVPGQETAEDSVYTPLPVSDDLSGQEQGGTGQVLQLPRPEGESVMCTQGAGGSFSHQSRATRYDIDIDTPNDADASVFAPAGGIVRVHTEAPSENFGNHVNIDLGNEAYVIVGHLKTVLVQDGQEIVVGQLIGIEGCTGLCSGDHVHIGMHRGDASLPAEFGESIPASYTVLNEAAVSSQQMQCGLPAARTYTSANTIALGYPDGTLLKRPLDPKVYLMEAGRLRWIVDEDAFLSRGYQFEDVIVASDEALVCYGIGEQITEIAPTAVQTDQLPEGALVREQSRSDVYVIEHGIARPIESGYVFHLMGLTHREVQYLPDGTLRSRVRGVGSCVSGVGCIDVAYATSCRLPETGGVPNEDDGSVDLLSLLDLDGGEFGVAYAPPANLPVEHVQVRMMTTDQQGNVQRPWSLAVFAQEHRVITSTLGGLAPGDLVYLRVDVGNTATVFSSCSRDDGELLVMFGENDLEPERVIAPDGGCADLVQIPGVPEFDQEPALPPEPTQQPSEEEESFDERMLAVGWRMPFGQTARRITLSGEYTRANGVTMLYWQSLMETEMTSEILLPLSGVESGDQFRFSVEFEQQNGVVSWSCVGPFVAGTSDQGTRQGTTSASVDGVTIPVQTVGDPSGETTGCGLLVEIP